MGFGESKEVIENENSLSLVGEIAIENMTTLYTSFSRNFDSVITTAEDSILIRLNKNVISIYSLENGFERDIELENNVESIRYHNNVVVASGEWGGRIMYFYSYPEFKLIKTLKFRSGFQKFQIFRDDDKISIIGMYFFHDSIAHFSKILYCRDCLSENCKVESIGGLFMYYDLFEIIELRNRKHEFLVVSATMTDLKMDIQTLKKDEDPNSRNIDWMSLSKFERIPMKRKNPGSTRVIAREIEIQGIEHVVTLFEENGIGKDENHLHLWNIITGKVVKKINLENNCYITSLLNDSERKNVVLLGGSPKERIWSFNGEESQSNLRLIQEKPLHIGEKITSVVKYLGYIGGHKGKNKSNLISFVAVQNIKEKSWSGYGHSDINERQASKLGIQNINKIRVFQERNVDPDLEERITFVFDNYLETYSQQLKLIENVDIFLPWILKKQ